MTAAERIDLRLERDEKQLLEKAAAASGMTVSAFVRSSMKERAQEVIDREQRVTLSLDDFNHFMDALEQPFQPNKALDEALETARKNVRRA